MLLQAKTDAAPAGHLQRCAMRAVLASLIATLLAACSSGSGGTDVTIGSGQGADPVTVEFPVFYVKRPVPDPEEVQENDARRPLRFEIGADLYMRDRASPSSPEVNVTAEETEGLGDIRDLDVNFDGSKVIFSMRAQFIEDADEEDQPTWNIWEYDAKTKALRRIIASATTAEEGHDIMPHYLPDGRIVFTSTRQRQSRAILLDENKPQFAAQVEAGTMQPAFVLHVMDADGTNINQITYNQSHDLDPTVMNDGRILYTHWEQALAGSQMDLYTINPDGSDRQLLYGAHSHATGTVNPATGNPSTIQFLQPRAMADNRTLALIRPFTGTNEGGDLVLIDTANYVDCSQSVPRTTIGGTQPCVAQTRALPTDVRTIPGPSPGGRFRSASPLFDGTGRLLVSWSACRLVEAGRIVPCTADRLNNTTTPPVEAPPLYGIYIYDVRDNTQKPIVAPQEGFIFTEVVAGSGHAAPPVILNRAPDVDFPQDLATEGVGILHIRSVYDIDGTVAVPGVAGGLAAVSNPGNAAYSTRPARFLRIEKVVSQPDEDTRDVPNTAFGIAGRRFGMRDILGYAPIEPDGSVKVKVPANVAFAISIVDANGRRLNGTLGQRHSNWLQVMPGETLECNGCHNAGANPPFAHGRKGLTNSANPGATTTGGAFPGTNPVLAPFDTGETMAQARSRAMCGPTQACPPSVDVAYDGYWTPDFTPGATTDSVDLCYSTASNVLSNPNDLEQHHTCATSLTTLLPTALACTTTWTSLCRITINYEQHIHPLWGVDRFVDVDGVDGNDLGPDGEPINHKCNTCHNPVGAANAVQLPGGNLDLTDGPSDDEADHFKSYRELLFADVQEQLNAMGQLEPVCAREEIDPISMLPVCVALAQTPPSMSGGGARASTRFFNTLEGRSVGTVDHTDFMSPSELRLLSEWLDTGAQYYNDPFAAPED